MARRVCVVIAICVAVVINVSLWWRHLPHRDDPLPPGLAIPPIYTAHQKRVDSKVEEIRNLSFEELTNVLDDEWVLVNSGVYGEALITNHSRHDFGLTLGCRVRRRFVQELDQLPIAERRTKIREAHSHWLTVQENRYDDRLQWLKGQAGDMQPFPVQGTKLAVCVILFCSARWNSAAETRELLSKSRDFSRRLEEEFPNVTDDEVVISAAPMSALPDSSFQISVLAYAAHRDRTIDRQIIVEMDNDLERFELEGLIQRVLIPWQAWDCEVDIFDTIAPANKFHVPVATAIDGESIVWYQLLTFDKSKVSEIFHAVESRLPQ